MTFPADLLHGPYTRDRAWDELKPRPGEKWEEAERLLQSRVNRSHYIHCRAGGMSHRKAWLRCYHGIDQDSLLHEFPPAIWALLLYIWLRSALRTNGE